MAGTGSPRRITRRRLLEALPAAALVAVAGVIAAALALAWPEPPTPLPRAEVSLPQGAFIPDVKKLERQESPDVQYEEAKDVVRRFVEGAVARRDLTSSYELVTDNLRQGLTLAEWKTGDIPVVPFPAQTLDVAFSDRQADVHFFSAVLESQAGEAAVFWVGLVEEGDRWLVDYWAPAGVYGAPEPPAAIQ